MTISQRFFQKQLTGSKVFLTIYASIVCFCTYSCMYAFRKPFSAATYHVGDVDFKVILVISQGLGYMISKFTGIKIISEMKAVARVSSCSRVSQQYLFSSLLSRRIHTAQSLCLSMGFLLV
jgi:hypothetical protein